ncbi:MAG TPA: DUF1559 domain-containing protein [Lacipirellulaceae bacterium]
MPRSRTTAILGVTALAAICLAAWAAIIKPAGDAVDATLCQANLFKIRHALLAYDSTHGALPPAYLAGADGVPAHSWRVLIMPYLDSWGLDSEAFNATYDFEQPWNGPNNATLLKPVQESRFACPCGSERDTVYTSYVVLTGNNTLFPSSRSVALSAIPKSQDPILVVEITNSNIQWTEPRDVSIDSIGAQANKNSLKLSRSHNGSFRYITVSGKTATLPADTVFDEIRRRAEVAH